MNGALYLPSIHNSGEVENIFHKHSHVLCLDRTLSRVLPDKPRFIYRKAPSFGDVIVKKPIDPPSRNPTFWDQKGFFACRKCKACRKVSRPMRKIEKFTLTSNNREFAIKHFITCKHISCGIRFALSLWINVHRTNQATLKN